MDNFGFFRVASCAPKVSVADCSANTDHIIEMAKNLSAKGVKLIAFPEMSVTSYTCADLFHNQALLDSCADEIARITDDSARTFSAAIVVGAPMIVGNAIYNCAFVIQGGSIRAIIPKTYIPNYNEFYEKRWWQAAPEKSTTVDIVDSKGNIVSRNVPFGTHTLIDINGVKAGVEICEDLWTPIPPSSYAAMAGADIIVNLSASDDLIGKYAYLRSLIAQQSARCICAYVYASAGYGESSTDLVFDGKTIIAENGTILACNQRWQSGNQSVISDIDIMALRRDRLHTGSFCDCAARHPHSEDFTKVNVSVESDVHAEESLFFRTINPTPFIPASEEAMADTCSEITNIQVAALAKRLDFIRCRTIVVGISGGLDSTLALLVAVRTFDRLGLDRKGIVGVTMPGFGTTDRTRDNALALMEQLGITIRTIPIGDAVNLHFRDIGHDPEVHDVTYENSQARERTQILMDVANQLGGIVLGTGDLSELALGWATYNGDHMSMYGVNAGVPKTLVKYLVRHFAMTSGNEAVRSTLTDIIDTPISPELIPADDKGEITQKTEDLVGPYQLHDFFLYYTLRYGFSPERILFLARKAFAGEFSDDVIEKWLRTFVRRFFQQQFKRSCLPDGPKVGSVCLSPRGDWRMPSDAVPFKF